MNSFSFWVILDLNSETMERVVAEMNRDGGWEVDDYGRAAANSKNDTAVDMEDNDANLNSRPVLGTDDVLALVEEMSMLHWKYR